MRISIGRTNLFSPYMLSIASLCFFVACALLPPNIYEFLMQEQDLLFLDLPTIAFYLACVGFFIGGMFLYGKFRSPTNPPAVLSAKAIALPLLAAILLNAFSVSVLLKNTSGLFTAWLVDARQVKRDLDATNALSNALPVLYATCWWAYMRLKFLKITTHSKQSLLTALLAAGFAFAIYTALMKAARYDLLPAVIGLFVIKIGVFSTARHHIFSLVKNMAVILVVSIGAFSVLAYLRGNEDQLQIFQSLAGYTIASYNRTAAIVNGNIQLPDAGTGTYAFRFLSNIPLLQSRFDIATLLNMPNRDLVYMNEFRAVGMSGLREEYNWVGTFGFIYADIGFWIFPYLAVTGMLVMAAWKSMRAGQTFGAILYPWAAFYILFWFGSNFFVEKQFITFIVLIFILRLYEILTSRKISL